MLFIFDVDGTLSPYRSSSTAPFERLLLPGVEKKCKQLLSSGHVLVIASNQSGARRGRENRLTSGAVHGYLRWLCKRLGITAYKFAIAAHRKKPSPTMLFELMYEMGFELTETIFIGDSQSDKEAADVAGCRFEWAEVFFNESP